MMKILILGGTGAMGTALVEFLAIDQKNQVYVTSRKEHDSSWKNVKYLKGDAHDVQFLKSVLSEVYDAIIDFMIYQPAVFEQYVELLLASTKQYFFLSSSRVYANSKGLITEQTPRLLDACDDRRYLNTDEYALAKAREENILMRSDRKNWTIIRPYITYNVERLQLGVLEKEGWLYRALKGKKIVFPEDMATHVTTMTYGGDVARGIVALIGKKEAFGEAFHIVGSDTMTWGEVLELYCEVIGNVTGNRPQVYWLSSSEQLWKVMGNEYQVRYDRLFDRRFDSEKFLKVCDGEFEFVAMKDGLTKCLTTFLNENKSEDMSQGMKLEAWMDRTAEEKVMLGYICGCKNKIKYLGWRFAPHMLQGIKDLLKK